MENNKPLNADILIAETEDLIGLIHILFSGKFGLGAIWKFVKGLILSAEKIYKDIQKAGFIKRKRVMEVWRVYDKKYKLVATIINAIPLPFWMRFATPFMARLIDIFIEYVLLDIIVWLFNSMGIFQTDG